MEIPRVMSTQHPDNVTTPFFAHNSVLAGEDEVQEAYYAYSHLGATEQMWDSEGKEVDNFVVEKLLSKYERFFRQKRLGRDVFLTLRVPNPDVERTQAKVLLLASPKSQNPAVQAAESVVEPVRIRKDHDISQQKPKRTRRFEHAHRR